MLRRLLLGRSFTTATTVNANPLPLHVSMAGGWAGVLARLHERGVKPAKIIECYRQMPKDTPLTVNCYNYLIGAHLQLGLRQEAYRLLVEMESGSRISRQDNDNDGLEGGKLPNVNTFELLLESFAKSPGLERTVEEMFELMVRRYGLEPSARCWLARLGCWLRAGERRRFVQLLGEARRRSGDLRTDASFYAGLLRQAILRGEWLLLEEELLPRLHPLKPLEANQQRLLLPHALFWQPECRLTGLQWEALWALPPMTATPASLPLVRYLFWQLEGLFELPITSWQRLLLYAGECGTGASDLALLALRALHKLEPKVNPDLLQAFVQACERPTVLPTGDPIPPIPLTPEHERLLPRIKELLQLIK